MARTPMLTRDSLLPFGGLLLGALLLTGCAPSSGAEPTGQALPPAASLPRGGGQFEPVDAWDPNRPYFMDLGTVTHGERRTHTFKLRNVGHGPIVVKRFQGACSCTRLTALRATAGPEVRNGDIYRKNELLSVPPGSVLELDIEVDSGKTSANIDKLAIIRVVTDSITDPFLTFEIHVLGAATFEQTPKQASLGDVPTGSGGAMTVRLFNRRAGHPARLVEVLETSPHLKATLEHFPSGSQNWWHLVVRLEENLPTGPYQGYVLLSTTDDQGEGADGLLQVDVTGSIVPDVMLYPRNLSFGQVQQGQTAQLEAHLKALVPGMRLKVLEARLEGPLADYATAEVTPLGPDGEGRAPQTDVRLELGGEPPVGRLDGTLILMLDDEQTPRIERPVVAVVRGAGGPLFPDRQLPDPVAPGDATGSTGSGGR